MPTDSTLLPMTLVVLTRNEAANIARCLDSVTFVAEKLVIDCGSTDDTVAIAGAHGARVEQHAWLGFGPQRNHAATLAANDWIIALDADEFLTPELDAECRARLPALMAGAGECITLRRRTWFMGAPMRWYRPMVGERMDRIYHRGRARWTEARVHEKLVTTGAAAALTAPFNHAENPSLVHKQLKVLLYSELKARDWEQKGRSPRMWQTPFVFLASFVKEYLLRLALLDGWRGFVVSHVAANYAVYKRLRYYEMVRSPASIEAARHRLKAHGIEK